MDPTPLSGRRRWLVVAAVVTAVAAGLLVPKLFRRPHPPTAILEAAPREETPQDRRHRLDAIDSTQKTAWVEDVPGVDLSAFDPGRREAFVRFANAERCTCGCGFTLAACRRYDSDCDVSGPRVQRLADSIAAGPPRDLRGLRARPAKSAE
jgi:hypothetical protein